MQDEFDHQGDGRVPTLQKQLTLGTTRSGADSSTTPAKVNHAGSTTPTDLKAEWLRSQQRLDAVTSILGGWVWETDTQHRFTYMSPSVARYAGREPGWHYGKTRQELGNLSVKTADGRSWVEQLGARQSFGPVDFLRYQGNTALWMRTIGLPQFDGDGNFTGYCGIAFELPTDPETEASERRSEPRRRTVRAAELIVTGSGSAITCVMVDISTTGARIHLPSDVPLPATLRLKVEAMSLDTTCAVRWRRDDEAGLEFI